MKCFLRFTNAFRPLASAEPTPFIKVLFDDGYVLSESYDPEEISYTFNGSLLETSFKSKETRGWNDMDLKHDLLKEISFAIDVYQPGSGFESGDCKAKSSEQLKPLIHRCLGDIKLRMLTAEEKRQTQAYKEEQKGKLEFT